MSVDLHGEGLRCPYCGEDVIAVCDWEDECPHCGLLFILKVELVKKEPQDEG